MVLLESCHKAQRVRMPAALRRRVGKDRGYGAVIYRSCGGSGLWVPTCRMLVRVCVFLFVSKNMHTWKEGAHSCISGMCFERQQSLKPIRLDGVVAHSRLQRETHPEGWCFLLALRVLCGPKPWLHLFVGCREGGGRRETTCQSGLATQTWCTHAGTAGG